jgi:hypothetical protein
MTTCKVRNEPEPGHRWFVRDARSGAVLGWFDFGMAHWFADDQRQFGRQVEIGYGWASLWQPPRAGRPQREPSPEPEAGS